MQREKRSREEIESLKKEPYNPTVKNWDVRLQTAMLEVLLDIRELLQALIILPTKTKK